MIEEMRLRDLGVIAEATLPMGPGFTAITGETGAGKTMVVTGLGLLLGARADSNAVRAGAQQATVAGVWIVPEHGTVADRVADAGGEIEPIGEGRAELYVSRSISSEGRSRASVGGRNAPAGVLGDLADHLIVVHGQSEQLRLRSAAAQRDALDRFGGDVISAALAVYQDCYERSRQVDAELAQLTEQHDARAAEAAELRAAIAQIEQVDPQPGEDEELTARAERLENIEDLRIAAATAHAALASEDDTPDVSVLIGEARRALERASDPLLAPFVEQLADLSYRAADVATALAGYLSDLDETGPQELQQIQERRSVLSGLIRQHGSLETALELLATGSARIMELDDDDDRIARLTQASAELHEQRAAAAEALTAARADAAGRLGSAVTAELHALAMPDARLEVAVTEAIASSHGCDEIALLLAPHPGATPRSIAKGASGGELSRVMLAIEVVIAATDPVPTFVFDEVDAGIGGAAAIEVGRRLATLAKTSQVIAVTHLAQVAAFATNHLSVVKANDGTVTASSVQQLTGAAREAEMARLLSGLTDSEAALDHARELLSLGADG